MQICQVEEAAVRWMDGAALGSTQDPLTAHLGSHSREQTKYHKIIKYIVFKNTFFLPHVAGFYGLDAQKIFYHFYQTINKNHNCAFKAQLF